MAAIEYAPVQFFRVSRFDGDDGFSLPRIRLRERRAAGARPLYWVMQRHLECARFTRTVAELEPSLFTHEQLVGAPVL